MPEKSTHTYTYIHVYTCVHTLPHIWSCMRAHPAISTTLTSIHVYMLLCYLNKHKQQHSKNSTHTHTHTHTHTSGTGCHHFLQCVSQLISRNSVESQVVHYCHLLVACPLHHRHPHWPEPALPASTHTHTQTVVTGLIHVNFPVRTIKEWLQG